MWDGKYITFTDEDYHGASAIYQMKPTKSGGLDIVGTTVFGGSCDDYTSLTQPFIVGTKNTPANDHQGNAVVAGNPLCHVSSNYSFSYWSYPAGGSPTHTLFDSPNDPVGQSVSIGT
jgi:hypothetical protein